MFGIIYYRFLKNKFGISWKIKKKNPKNPMCFMNNEVTCFLLKPLQIKKFNPHTLELVFDLRTMWFLLSNEMCNDEYFVA
jgi:hypothetical protein